MKLRIFWIRYPFHYTSFREREVPNLFALTPLPSPPSPVQNIVTRRPAYNFNRIKTNVTRLVLIFIRIKIKLEEHRQRRWSVICREKTLLASRKVLKSFLDLLFFTRSNPLGPRFRCRENWESIPVEEFLQLYARRTLEEVVGTTRASRIQGVSGYLCDSSCNVPTPGLAGWLVGCFKF